MPDKLFQVPASQGEIAQDRLAFENWQAGIEPDFGPIPYNRELERRTARQREQWARRSNEREQLATAALKERILRQRLAREGSPLLRKAMLDEARRVHQLAQIVCYRGKPCPRCGLTLRYRSSHRCVACVTTGGFYHGNECARCGSNLRYIATDKCVACAKKRASEWNKEHRVPQINIPLRQQRENRTAALIAGTKRFEGRPCGKCGTTTRYTKGNRCVACDTAAQRVRKNKKKNAA